MTGSFLRPSFGATEQDRTALVGWAITVVLVAAAAVVCAALIHATCFDPTPPLLRPEAGSPAAHYCSTVNPWKPWLSFTLVPTAIMVVVGWPLRRHALLVVLLALIIVGVIAANVAYANSLHDIGNSPLT